MRAIVRKPFAFMLVVTFVIAVGCGGSKPRNDGLDALVRVQPTTGPRAVAGSPNVYTLKSGDRLGVRVLNDAALNSTVEIQMDGRVAIPWAGTIQAAGRDLVRLESEIEDSLRTYLRNPEVSLNIESFGPSRVFVTGEVAVPGAYTISAGQTVLGAIAAAGGLQTTASTHDVMLLRRTGEREASVHHIDVQDVLKGSTGFADPLVQHLDIVHVPRTFIADVGIFVDQFFTRLRPAFSFYLEGWEAFNVANVRVVNVERVVQ